jgi:N-acetylated-alpha-linked acidic dipeptidase
MKEYHPLDTKDPDLPAPSTARPARRTPLGVRLAILAALGCAAYLAYPRHEAAPLTPVEQHVQAYVDGVASKGFGLVGCKGSHGFSGHGHNKPKWIPPHKAEEIYLTVPTNDSCAAASERYTAHAHPGGSGWDLVTAQMVKGDWERELGLKASWYDENVFEAGSGGSQSRVRDSHKATHPYVWIDTYYPVMNTPVHAAVTLLSDPPVHAKLREAKLDGDPGSELADEVRVFHGLSVSGDVTAQYIYAGYGRKDDFDLLQSKGVDFTGKIAVVKYGGNFRGLKVKAAQEAGAVGCIIFTDPGDDGEITEWNGHKQYPEGPARVVSSSGAF